MNSFKIIVWREGAPLPSSAGVVDHDVAHSAMEEKQCEFILQEQYGEYACETKFTVHLGKVGMAFQTAKSFIKVEPTDDGGMMMKVECSYKLMPVPSVEAAQAVQEQEETPETHEMGGGAAAANFKVKQD